MDILEGYVQFPCFFLVVLLFLSMDISQTCHSSRDGDGGGEDVKMDLELELKKVSSWVEKLGGRVAHSMVTWLPIPWL